MRRAIAFVGVRSAGHPRSRELMARLGIQGAAHDTASCELRGKHTCTARAKVPDQMRYRASKSPALELDIDVPARHRGLTCYIRRSRCYSCVLHSS